MNPLVPPLAPLELVFKPDAAEAQRRMRAYWQGEIVDRACASVRAPKDGRRPPPRSLIVAEDFDFPAAVEKYEAWAAEMFFGGEAMPALMPNYGPDQWAGFFGARLTLAPEKDTSWAEPLDAREDWPDLRLDPANPWWNAILALAELAAERGRGKFILSAIDTHSNLDCLSALRGPGQLCLDLIDRPDKVLHALEQIQSHYEAVYETLFRVGRMDQHGSTSWLDMWSEGRTQAVQCDFCYMISQEHFRRFALPSLEHEMACLDHAVYHMDGPGQLRHLDDLLALPRLHTIQWVPGAGQPTAPAWLEMLKKIQRAGKSVQVLVSVEEVKQIYAELAPEKTFYWVLDCPNESEARRLLEWMVRNT